MILILILLLMLILSNSLYINSNSNSIRCNNKKDYSNNILYSSKHNDYDNNISITSTTSTSLTLSNIIKRSSSTILLSLSLYGISITINPIESANAVTMKAASVTGYREALGIQSPGWELARQKRTIAIKEMVDKGMMKIDTDDSGNQFLKLPWIPDKKVPYKSLSLTQRLLNEVCAGAFGEIAKDVILHPVDTAKTRKQAKKKSTADDDDDEPKKEESGFNIKDFYAGFPVVLASSIPQGGTFFLIKKSSIEAFNYLAPGLPTFISSTVSIGLAAMGYWSFRTPAEVVKTQVQTGQSPNVIDSIDVAKAGNANGLLGLWKHYPVMLFLDIPFQIINFVLYGLVSNAVEQAGYETSILTRLFCGITCGMIAAGATCPIDVCKTRILARDKEQQNAALASLALQKSIIDNNDMTLIGATKTSDNMQMINESTGNVAVIERPIVSSISEADNTNSQTIDKRKDNDNNVVTELLKIAKEEGIGSLFLGIRQRLLYTGLANGIRLAAYGTSRMDLMMRSLDDL